MTYQLITVVGNAGRSPDLRYTPLGEAVCDFAMAVNKKTKSGDTWTETTTWFKVVTWGKLAETVNLYVTKGREVLAIGTISTEAWIGKDGTAKSQLVLTARDVQFLGGNHPGPTPAPAFPDQVEEETDDEAREEQDAPTSGDVDLLDIPF